VNYAESVAWRPEIEGYSEDILPFFTEIAPRIPQGGTYLEVGVYKGRSFRFMRELRPDLYMIAVDPWTDESVAASHGTGEDVYRAFGVTMNGVGYGAPLFDIEMWGSWRMSFSDFVQRDISARLGFIFLDGDHNYPGVCADIIAARKILRPGGILAGHDFAGDNGVVKAVKELAPGYQLAPWDGPELCGNVPGHSRCWWKVMP
jgi:hypothetical protein